MDEEWQEFWDSEAEQLNHDIEESRKEEYEDQERKREADYAYYELVSDGVFADEDTGQLISWKVRSEVMEEIAVLRTSMKPMPPPQPGVITEPPIMSLTYDDVYYLLSSHLKVAHLLYATSKHFQAAASAVLHEQVPMFMLIGSVPPEQQKWLGRFAQRHELINGRPSYLSTHPMSNATVYFCAEEPQPTWTCGWLTKPVCWLTGGIYSFGNARGQDPDTLCDTAAYETRDMFRIMMRSYDHPQQLQRLGTSILNVATLHSVANIGLGRLGLIALSPGRAPIQCLRSPIQCLSFDALTVASASAPSTVHLTGWTADPKHQHALGVFTKLDELIGGYAVFENAKGYRLWHARNLWCIGPWEIEQGDGHAGGHATSSWLHVEDSRIHPDKITGTWMCKPQGIPSDSLGQAGVPTGVQCLSTQAYEQKLARAVSDASPVLALCGNTPNGAHREVLGKYNKVCSLRFPKVSSTVNGYPIYANAHDQTIVLWRHKFGWTVGHCEQLKAGKWGHLVVVDSSMQPESIIGMWQVFGAAGGVEDAPDVRVFLPAPPPQHGSRPRLPPRDAFADVW